MRTRTLLVILVIALVTGFAAVNWDAFTTATTLSLGPGLGSVQAPLGLVMLGLMGAMVLVFALYMAVWQGSILMDTRRHTKELQAQRALADQAEASRFTELRAVLQAEMAQLAQRLDASQQVLRREIQDSGNSIAAVLGEMDDRFKTGPGRDAR